MPVLEQISDKIFTIASQLSEFILEDEQLKQKLEIFVSNHHKGMDRESLSAFMFDEVIEENKKSVDFYIERNLQIPEEDRRILKNFNNSIYGIFQIKKVLKDGFELYNLVNEKNYSVKSLIKMSNYKGLGTGSFLDCRLVPFDNDDSVMEYYMFVLNAVFGISQKKTAYRKAVSIQIETPESIYYQNTEKLTELEKLTEELKGKFMEFFGKNEVITTSSNIDKVLNAFNDFAEDGSKPENINELIISPENYGYFEVEGSKDPFDIYNAAEEKRPYDVGIIFDPDLGIQVLPFYGTFRHVFESEDPANIEGYEQCVIDYYKNKKVPPFILKNIYSQVGEKFVEISKNVFAKKALDIEEKINFDGIMEKFKSGFYNPKKFSSTTILFASEAFELLMGASAEENLKEYINSQKIGRNDPCLCGSGKKFKKCCMNSVI